VSATRFAQLTGVSRDRLRTWERRHGFPRPVRIAGGPRRYLVADITRVVAVRRAAEDGVPLPAAIAAAARAPAAAGLDPAVFRATVELTPAPVAFVSGPAPLRLEWANAALRRMAGAPAAGAEITEAGGGPPAAVLSEHLAHDLATAEVDHPAWGGGPPGRSVVYRLPVRPGERPVVAVVGIQTHGERDSRAELAAARAELAVLRRRTERHDRWLDALAALAAEFQHEPGPDVIGTALDVLVRQTRAVDAGLASYLSGSLALHGSRRGALAPHSVTVAAHPDLGRVLRDVRSTWLEPTTAAVLGVPAGLHASGVPVAVAGEVLGLLVLVFDEPEPHDADNRRLLASVSAALGFALLRDRLQREVHAAAAR